MDKDKEELIRRIINIIEPIVIQSDIYKINLIKTSDLSKEDINDIKDALEYEKPENKKLIQDILDEENNEYKKEKIYKYKLKKLLFQLGDYTIHNLNPNIDYYSAYPKDMSKEIFSQKYIIWMSDIIHQSLLHPLDTKKIIQPIFFKFRLNKSLLVINSDNYINKNIFYNSFNFDDSIIDNIKNEINLIKGIELDTENIFLGNNNKYILYVIEAINRIVGNPDLLIYGYKNKNDQEEIALIKFNEIIDKTSIKKYKYTKIICDSKEFTFPLSNEEDIRKLCHNIHGFYKGDYLHKNIIVPAEFVEVSKKELKKKMMCHSYDLQIYYQIEDNSESEQYFDCSDKKAQYFWAGKYKKYKQKYLELKNKLKK